MAATSFEAARPEGLATSAGHPHHDHRRTDLAPPPSPSITIEQHFSDPDDPSSSSVLLSHTPSPVDDTPPLDPDQAPGILDRRKSKIVRNPRASLSRQRSVGGGSGSIKRTSRIGKPGLGPLLPVIVPMAEPEQHTPSADGETSAAHTPDTFEEASEVIASADGSETSAVEGLGIGGDGTGESNSVTLEPADPSRGHVRQHSRQKTLETAPQLVPNPVSPRPMSRERSLSPAKRVAGLSGDVVLPSPPPSTADRINALQERQIGTGAQSPPTMARKASSGIAGLLGRMGSIRRPGKSPPAPRQEGMFKRRSTAASIDSTAAGSLAAIADGPEDGVVRPSLQDQFQTLRKQENGTVAGVNGHQLPDEGDKPPEVRRRSSNASTTGPPSPVKARSGSSSAVKSPLLSPVDPELPPGTAAGLTAGPAELPKPVDWDLWQALVMEGPAAVTRSSGEVLRDAIASGIPAAIRGVVWQVLAESKNEELEALYQTLKSKGAEDADQPSLKPPPVSRSASHGNVLEIHGEDDKADEPSRESSAHSTASTPPASALASPAPSVLGEEAELRSKLLVEQQKREAESLVKLERAIRRDLGSRTSFSKYAQSAGLQDGLFGLCKAYALFDEGVGYAQGINFIAMPLLFSMSEGEAFALLVRLMSKYDVRGMFAGDMAGLHLRLYQFERLLEDHDPALYCHLKRRSVAPQLYATQWFLTLFAYRFPLQLVLRVYDLVFSEGLTAILKFGLVLLRRNRDALLAMSDMGQLTTFLKEKVFDVYIDRSPSASSLLDSGFFGAVVAGGAPAERELYRADEMVRDAADVRIPDATLAAYTQEWEEAARAAAERDNELETLRAANAALTAQVRGLQARGEAHDAEHVALAGESVRVKVANDALQDEVEGLRLRGAELQRLVDAQPAEVEAMLRDEMQRIMQRNAEVQNENRALREDLDETERALVSTKMLHAQTQSDHDALKKRWANIQALLNET